MQIYLIGLLVVVSCLLLWFYSPLKQTISDFIEIDLDAFLLSNQLYSLAKILNCFICMSFWLSLIAGLVVVIVFHFSFWYSLITMFTYPALAYGFKKIYDI